MVLLSFLLLDISLGVDFMTYKHGLYQIFVQSEDLAKKIFQSIDYDYSGFLNWQSFLDLMFVIKAKTIKDKIDLFIKVSIRNIIQIADEDGNGKLSAEEVFKLCKTSLSKFMNSDQEFLNLVCQYYTKLIFSSVGFDPETEEIPLEKIKEAILSVKISTKPRETKKAIYYQCSVVRIFNLKFLRLSGYYWLRGS